MRPVYLLSEREGADFTPLQQNVKTSEDVPKRDYQKTEEKSKETATKGKQSILVASVEDNAIMISVSYFENHVSYFVQNQRQYTLLFELNFCMTAKCFDSTRIYN